jgi:hypothetical protein
LVVREFKASDAQRIQSLFKHTLAENGYFIRDESFIKYSMEFPEVSDDGIFIAEANNQVVGFAVVSFVQEKWGKVGVVLELQCVDSSSFSDLIQTLTKYCASKNADAMAVYPHPSTWVSTVLRGWEKVEHGVMLVKPVSLSPLLQELLLQEKTRKISQGKTITFYIDGEAIKITDEKIQTTEVNDLAKGGVIISLSSKTFVGILLNQLSPLLSWLKGKIKIKGITNIALALKLLNELKLKDFMYVSLADRI